MEPFESGVLRLISLAIAKGRRVVVEMAIGMAPRGLAAIA
jgi:hypothetical protein